MRALPLLCTLVMLGVLSACQSRTDKGMTNPRAHLPPIDERMVELERKLQDPTTSRTYPIFQFGNWEWMGKNLALKVANSWCYDNDDKNCRDYGQLYTAASAKYACSALGARWRLPTLEEWKSILLAHGGYITEDQSTVGPSPQAALFNLTNDNLPFRAKASGFRNIHGGYLDQGVQAFFWTSSEKALHKTTYAIALEENGVGFKVTPLDNKAGGSCRCVRSY